eukprot:gene22265-27227_t
MRVYSDLSKELSKSTLAQCATVRKKLEKLIPLHFGSQQLKEQQLLKLSPWMTSGIGCFADYLVEHLKTGRRYGGKLLKPCQQTELYPDFAKVLKDEGHAASRITFNLIKKGVNNKVVHINSNAADEGSPPDEKGDLMAMADRVILTLDMSLCVSAGLSALGFTSAGIAAGSFAAAAQASVGNVAAGSWIAYFTSWGMTATSTTASATAGAAAGGFVTFLRDFFYRPLGQSR